MTLGEKANEAMARASELRATAEAAFLSALHTEFAVIRTICNLAQDEDGEVRAHHLHEAEAAFETALELARCITLSERLRYEIEGVRQDISALGGFGGIR